MIRLLTLFLALPALVCAQPRIDVVFPTAGQHLRASEAHFIYGRISPSDGELTINGRTVAVYRNGAFIAYLPVTPGPFDFEISVSADGDSAVHSLPVVIDSDPVFSGAYPEIDLASLSPRETLIMTAGDELTISFRATPNCEVSFSVAGSDRWFAMAANEPGGDTYSGTVVFSQSGHDKVMTNGGRQQQWTPNDDISARKIIVQVKNQLGAVAGHAFGNLTVAIPGISRPARVAADVARMEMTEDRALPLFLESGTRLTATGRRGEYWRIELAESLTGWIHANELYWLSEQAVFDSAAIGPVVMRSRSNSTRIAIAMSDRLPFRVVQPRNPQKLQLIIWGETPRAAERYATAGAGIVKKAAWQPMDQAVELSLELNVQQQWGYFTRFKDDSLVLDLRHPPKMGGGSPVADRLILLDPGHHPDQGAVGPTRLEERDVNWAIVDKLKSMLEARGARVLLSRTQEQGATIQARTEIAELTRPDILVSVHNNALPEGFDPLRPRGTSTFYYHPHSRRLAETIQRNLAEELKLRDHGVRRADLAVCRLTGLPAVLVECAFMILPQQEYLLGTEQFQHKIARSLMRSIEQYFRKYAV